MDPYGSLIIPNRVASFPYLPWVPTRVSVVPVQPSPLATGSGYISPFRRFRLRRCVLDPVVEQLPGNLRWQCCIALRRGRRDQGELLEIHEIGFVHKDELIDTFGYFHEHFHEIYKWILHNFTTIYYDSFVAIWTHFCLNCSTGASHLCRYSSFQWGDDCM